MRSTKTRSASAGCAAESDARDGATQRIRPESLRCPLSRPAWLLTGRPLYRSSERRCYRFIMTAPVPFATDEPITKSDHDRFGRKQFAWRVAHTIAHRGDPSCIVVGIYGAWGEGKTSVLRMVDEALASEKNVKTFWFNPWRYRDEDTLLEQFFRSMARALGTSISSKTEELGGLLSKYKYLVAPIFGVGGSVAKHIADMPPGVGDGAAAAAEHVGNIAEGLSDVDAETLKDRIDRRLAVEDRRLVVFMDDLDRLDHQEIQAVFRLVKLTLSFTNTAFVLAFDDEVVEQALGAQFGPASRKFLEKIIQVPLQLPRVDILILREFCFKGVDEALRVAEIELTDAETRRYVEVFDSGILSRLTTPRMARRYGNALTFALPLLKGEVNTVDLMLIEAVRVFYPRLYASIRGDRDLYLWSISDHVGRDNPGFREKKQQAILGALNDLSEEDREAAIRVVKALFPRNTSLLSQQNTGYYADIKDSWNMEKRVASPEYFDRYFGYGIPPNDISDSEFASFVTNLLRNSRDEINAALQRLCSNGRAERFLEKVRVGVRILPVEQCRPLAVAICANATLFPGDHGGSSLSFGDFRETAAIRVYWLVERLGPADRLDTLLECMNVVSDPIFALEVLRQHLPDADGNAPITPDELAAVRSAAIARLRTGAQKKPLWHTVGRDAAFALSFWAETEGKDATTRYLMRWFVREPRETLAFLESMLAKARQLYTGRPVRVAFSKRNYETVAGVADAEQIAQIVRQLGFTPKLGDKYEEPDDAPEKQTARRFLAWHEQAQSPVASPEAEAATGDSESPRA